MNCVSWEFTAAALPWYHCVWFLYFSVKTLMWWCGWLASLTCVWRRRAFTCMFLRGRQTTWWKMKGKVMFLCQGWNLSVRLLCVLSVTPWAVTCMLCSSSSALQSRPSSSALGGSATASPWALPRMATSGIGKCCGIGSVEERFAIQFGQVTLLSRSLAAPWY